MDRTILVVDDDAVVINELQRIFSSLGYCVLSAENGELGLELLARETVELVICDMQMPGIDGHQFLKQVRALYPRTMRTILSGFSGGKDVVGCLRDGSASLYIVKPWDENRLVEQIDKLLRLGELFSSRRLLASFNKMGEMPTTPELYGQLCGLIERDAGLEEIAGLVERDQSVAAKLLQVANSVYYNTSTGSVRQAIVFVGLANLKSIVLGLSVFKQLNGLNQGFFSRDVLWDHADRVNRLTNAIFGRFLGRKMNDSEAAAGLLHDIGRVMLIRDYSLPYSGVYQSVFKHKNETLRDTERSLMGISHDEAGGFLLNWWSLPHPIVEAAMFHHDPLNPAVIHKELVAAVHVADYYAWKQQKALVLPRLFTEVFDILGASEESCEEFLQ